MAKQSIKFNSPRGVEFLNQITLEINKETGADYSFVAKISGEPQKVKTISLCSGVDIIDNVEHFLNNTPCEQVLDSTICVYTKGIQDYYPKHQLIVDMNISGFVGCPLFSANKKEMIGIMVSLFKNEIKKPDEVVKRFKYLAPRIELELDNVILSEKLKVSKQKYNNIRVTSGDEARLNEIEEKIKESQKQNENLSLANNDIALLYSALVESNEKLEKIVNDLFISKQELVKRNHILTNRKNILLELESIKELDLSKVLEEITKKASKTLGVERVSFWRFEKENTEIECVTLYKATENIFESGAVLKEVDFPNYFESLATQKSILANDACTNEHTKEFSENYLKLLGITSMLDVFVEINGESVGVVCFENVGKKRVWEIDDEQFAVSIASNISLAIESSERREAELKIEKQNKALVAKNKKYFSLISQLAISEKKYRSIFNSLIDVYYRTDANGKILEISPSVKEISGYEPSDFIGELFENKFGFNIPREELVSKINKFGFINGVALTGVKKNGEQVHVEVNMKAIFSEGGEYLGQEGIARDDTERIRTLTKLKESEEKFKAFVEQSIEPISITDIKGNYFFVNKPYCKLMGYTEKEILKMTVFDMAVDAKDAAEFSKTISSPILGDRMLKRKDGSCFLASVATSNIVSGDEKYTLGIIKDITKEREFEFKLRESEALLRKSQGIAKLGSYSFDIVKDTWKSSVEASRIFEIEDGESESNSLSTWLATIHPEDREMMRSYLVINVLESHDTFNKEYRIITENNHIEKWIHDIGELEFDETGKAIRLYGTIQDITERKVIEEQLKESTKEVAYIRNALNQYSIVAITDVKGKIIHANENFCKISGYSEKELLGQDHGMLNSGYHSKAFFKDLWRTIANGGIWSSEIRNKSKKGKMYWVDTTIIPTLNDEGKPFQYVVIRNDVTSRKHAEEKLKNLLISKDVLLKEVHHRVKNNLQIISALLALKETDNPEIKSFVKESNARIKSMALLHENIYQSKDLGRFSFKEYLTHLVSYLFDSYGVENGNVSYVINVEENINLRLKDAITLGLIVTEIVTNALKYSFVGRDKGEVKISFTKGDELIHFNIKDDGVGMDIEQGKKKTMGMLIITSLAKQLGGKLEVKGDDGVEYSINYKNKGS